MSVSKRNRVLITGGGTFLGINLASALLAEGAEVTLILREGNEDRLGPLESRVRWLTANVWDVASLKGRARGHGTVIHTVGSMTADPARGLTYHRLNVVSARNVANMCVSDGVAHMVLMSAVGAPWISRRYVNTKRDAESYLRRVGLQSSIVRAPLTYVRGTERPIFYRLMTLLGNVPPLSWTPLGNIAPMPLDILARGVARIALDPPTSQRMVYARELRQLNTRNERRGIVDMDDEDEGILLDDTSPPVEMLDDDATPFGWKPPVRTDEER